MTLPAPPIGTAPDLDFEIEGAEAVRFAVSPTLKLSLRIRSGDERAIHTLLLDVQVRLAARRRHYEPGEEERLTELFGPPEIWKSSLSTFLWTQTTLYVPGFRDGETTVEMPVPCTYDFEVSATKYLDALNGGEVPLELLFAGTMFYADEGGAQRVARLPLDREASYAMPLGVWREAMDACFPGGAWLRVDRARFDRLAGYRARRALPTWEAVVDELLDGCGD